MRLRSAISWLWSIAGTSWPSTCTVPLSGLKMPMTCLSVTLLPVPDGPISTKFMPLGTFSVRPWRI